MQRLAELLPQIHARGSSVLSLQARLFGVGGLLPQELADAAPDSYLRRLWDNWWRERDRFGDLVLPRELWHFNGLRPANQPQRRLALAAHWLGEGKLLAKLETWFTTESEKPLLDSLLECLQPPEDEFWSLHWSFRSARLPKPQPLLGSSRLTDLAINVVLPWFWMRAHAGQNERLEKVAEDRFFEWPMAQDNALLRLARQRLFGKTSVNWLKSAAAQQGLLQVVRDCCNHSNAICEQCPFPDLVRSWETHVRAEKFKEGEAGNAVEK